MLVCEEILDERAHPEQGFRACLGILRLARSYGQQRLRCRVTERIGWLTSIPGDFTATLECLVDSPMPIAWLGYDPRPDGETIRILPAAIER